MTRSAFRPFWRAISEIAWCGLSKDIQGEVFLTGLDTLPNHVRNAIVTVLNSCLVGVGGICG
jgi:hypothetical protein